MARLLLLRGLSDGLGGAPIPPHRVSLVLQLFPSQELAHFLLLFLLLLLDLKGCPDVTMPLIAVPLSIAITSGIGAEDEVLTDTVITSAHLLSPHGWTEPLLLWLSCRSIGHRCKIGLGIHHRIPSMKRC